MKIILIGMPGSGKSSLAAEISNVLGLKHIDSDVFIENRYNLSINDIFKYSGENVFRKYEHEALKTILEEENIVLSTGGGMPCFYNNIDLMYAEGITVYLKVSVETLMSRLSNDQTVRPLLKEKSNQEIQEYLEKSINDREKYYLKANYIIDAENTIKEIMKLLPFNY